MEREGSFNLSVPCNISSVRKTGARTQGNKPQVGIEVEAREAQTKACGRRKLCLPVCLQLPTGKFICAVNTAATAAILHRHQNPASAGCQ